MVPRCFGGSLSFLQRSSEKFSFFATGIPTPRITARVLGHLYPPPRKACLMTSRSYIRTPGLSRFAVTFFSLQNPAVRCATSHKKQFRSCAPKGSRVCNSSRCGSACVTHKMGQFGPGFGTIAVKRNHPASASEVSSKEESRRSNRSGLRPKDRAAFGGALPRQGLPAQHRPQAPCRRSADASGAHRSEPRDGAGFDERIRPPRSGNARPRARVAGDGPFCTAVHARLQRTLAPLRLPALWVVEALPTRRHVPSLPTVAGGVLC